MLIRPTYEVTRAPFLDGPGSLVSVYARQRLVTRRCLAYVAGEHPQIVPLTRRAARRLHDEVEALAETGGVARAAFAGLGVDVRLDSPTTCAVTFTGGAPERTLYRANVLNVLRPLR